MKSFLYFMITLVFLGNSISSFSKIREPEMLKNLGTIKLTQTITFHSWVNGLAYFTANDSLHGQELWRSDGTEDGTFLLKDIYEGHGSSDPYGICDLNGYFYFTAYDTAHGYEMWKTDGTHEGTILVKDMNPGDGIFYPVFIGKTQNYFYLKAFHPDYGWELWKSDGTAEGTVLLKDIYVGPGQDYPNSNCIPDLNSNPNRFYDTPIESNGKQIFIFQAYHPDYGIELWKTDGTPDGTQLLKDINTGTNDYTGNSTYPYSLRPFVINGVLIFPAYTPTTGFEFWRTDGTTEGTYILKDIYPGSTSSIDDKAQIVISDNKFYFYATHPTTGKEIWVSDGTTEGTKLIKDMFSGQTEYYTPWGLCTFRNKIFFSAVIYKNGNYIRQLFSSDGTPDGTVEYNQNPLPELDGTPNYFYHYKNDVYFFKGYQLWKTSGELTEATLVKTINSFPTETKPPRKVFYNSSDNLLFFFVDGGYMSGSQWISRYETWRTDGTEAGTFQLPERFDLNNCISNNIYFGYRRDTSEFHGVWVSDGTIEGTRSLKTFPKPTASPACYPITINNTLFLCGNLQTFISDGTAEGTQIFTKVRIFPDDDRQNYLKIGNKLFFTGSVNLNQYSLWVTDGTYDGTKLLKAFNFISKSMISSFRQFKNLLFFETYNSSIDIRELWRSDGTEEGTFKLALGSTINDTTENLAFFFGYNPTSKLMKVWTTDGSLANTREITWLSEYDRQIDYQIFGGGGIVAGNKFFFAGMPIMYKSNGTPWYPIGRELCVTDGTIQGSIIVKDILPGELSSLAHCPNEAIEMSSINGICLVNARNSGFCSDKYQIWRSDGTYEGTYPLGNDNVGKAKGKGNGLTNRNNIGRYTYYWYQTYASGCELWKTDGTIEGTSVAWDHTPGICDNFSFGNVMYPPYQFYTIFNKYIILSGPDLINFPNCAELNSATSYSGYGYPLLSFNTETEVAKRLKMGLFDPGRSIVITNNNVLYFIGNDKKFGVELWKTNGEPENTSRVSDICKSWTYSTGLGHGFYDDKTYINPIAKLNGSLFFNANTAFEAQEPYKFDTRLGLDIKDLSTCYGSTVVLAASDAVEAGSGKYTVSWSPSAGLDNPNIITARVVNPTQSEDYTVTVHDEITDETVSGTVHVQVYPKPGVTLTVDPRFPVPGSAENTIYLGYGAQSVSISATPGYGYLWSSDKGSFSSVNATITVSPTETTEYTVLVTNEAGCTNEAKVTIKVIDARALDKNNDMLIVCHNGRSIEVNRSAILAHLNHGDLLGPCSAYAKGIPGEEIEPEFQPDELSVRLKQNYPNPFAQLTEIQYFVSQREHATLLLTDINGRVVANLIDKYVSPGWNTIIVNGSGLTPGTYILRLESLGKAAMLKIVKMD